MEKVLEYPHKGFKPLVIESFRKITYNGKGYKRRLRINKFNAYAVDEMLGTFVAKQNTQFVVLDEDDMEKACKVLMVDYKPNSYFHIDIKMCSFKEVPKL